MTMAQNFKPVLVQDPMPDPNRKALAAAIALYAGAKRDVRVADEAARLAAQKCWDVEAQLEDLRKVAAPNGSLASELIASIASGNPCGASVLERSSVASHAKMTAAENELNIWTETRLECDEAAREQKNVAVDAKERLDRAARMVVCNSKNVAKLIDALETKQAEIVEKRSALRFISSHGCNGELAPVLSKQIERVQCQDLSGLGYTDSYRAWAAAFEALLTDADTELPEIARMA